MWLFTQLSWYFRREWRRYTVAMLLLIMVALLNLLPPWITGRIVDAATNDTLTSTQLFQQLGLIAIVALLVYVFRYLWRLSLYSASYQLGAILRQRFHDHLLRLPASFFQRHKTGDLMARATNDVSAVEMFAGEAMLALFDGILTGIVVLLVLVFAIHWQLTLVALLPWPLMAYWFMRINKELHAGFEQAQARFSDLNDRAQESISGIRMLKAYGLEQLASNQFDHAAEAASNANMQVARAEAKYDPVIFLTTGSSFLLAVAYGAWLIHNNQLSVGELTSFTLYLGFLIWPMFAYGWLLNLMERGVVAWQRLDAIMQTEPDIVDAGTQTLTPNAVLEWNINRFSYPEHSDQITRTVLQNFHGQLQPGQTLGIVGPTGSGKSTFIRLLLRQYESPDANIQFDLNPLHQFPLAELHRHMVVVPQESFLFSTSIAANIALGNPEATEQQIHHAAQLANVHHDILAFPNGYQTLVGERGITLSGGQKQRLAIARALLMDAPLLILDDALSAVDVATEQQILRHLRQARHNRTAIIVCHRLTAVEQADHIVVLTQGQPTEQGRHAELMAHNGWYAQMVRYQQIEQAVEEGR
ncbi:MAG: multidrug ABC transporter permease/ATP-binding protein [Pseudomonadales bacterium]|nr:multidrug ABC transporter permease/ATP-binding protein [Pseudomonadales bacterium]